MARHIPAPPGLTIRLALWVYRALWFVAMPAVLFYLWRRGQKDRAYLSDLAQRFGFYRSLDPKPKAGSYIWIHAVSLGELRSAQPIINALLDAGKSVVVTSFTPAGKQEAKRLYGSKIQAVWVPFDYGLAFRRFFRAFQPEFGLVMEIEFWPGMIMAAYKNNVPLFLCNGQYPEKSFRRDTMRKISVADIVRYFAGVMVKTEEQAARFRQLQQHNIAITGEMRFDQPIPQHQKDMAARAKKIIGDRPTIALCSVTKDEEDVFIEALQIAKKTRKDHPLFVFVPRAPEQFARIKPQLVAAGLTATHRSEVLDADLRFTKDQNLGDFDILIGDSLGEMYFYLLLADRAVIGGGFTPKGSHNIIEAISLRKPTAIGPEFWTIEYPAQEAIAAGICKTLSAKELGPFLSTDWTPTEAKFDAFMQAHSGTVEKTLTAVRNWLD